MKNETSLCIVPSYEWALEYELYRRQSTAANDTQSVAESNRQIAILTRKVKNEIVQERIKLLLRIINLLPLLRNIRK